MVDRLITFPVSDGISIAFNVASVVVGALFCSMLDVTFNVMIFVTIAAVAVVCVDFVVSFVNGLDFSKIDDFVGLGNFSVIFVGKVLDIIFGVVIFAVDVLTVGIDLVVDFAVVLNVEIFSVVGIGIGSIVGIWAGLRFGFRVGFGVVFVVGVGVEVILVDAGRLVLLVDFVVAAEAAIVFSVEVGIETDFEVDLEVVETFTFGINFEVDVKVDVEIVVGVESVVGFEVVLIVVLLVIAFCVVFGIF